MANTIFKLGGLLPNDAKLTAPIFTTPGKPFRASVNISATGDHTKNVSITTVYWDDGKKKLMKDYLAGGATTPIDITISKPTTLPPFVIYLQASGLYGVIEINVEYDIPLILGGITERDTEILDENKEVFPILNGSDINQQPKNNVPKIKKLVETASVTPSPLIVDLDGDGVETVSAANGVYFDHDGNGFAERTGWVGQDDGLLVRDLNNNGQIDNGSELFGNNTVLSNGKKAANGFEALKDLDSNSDGIFNSSDTAWNEVKVWKDSNPNGLVDNGEFITL